MEIALQEGVVKDDQEIIEWDGKERYYKEWNNDQTIGSALKFSCVWVYQGFTKEIEDNIYKKYLKEINYGNMETGTELSTFWLDGDLRISAFEQIDFLKNMYAETLPFSERNYSILKKNLIVEKRPGYTLYAKTGLTLRVKQKTGWYVGYVETDSDVWFFAINLAPRDEKDYPLRQEICYKALGELGIIP